MLSGYNNDIAYQGRTFHVQTEDCGRERPFVRTILFCKGNVVASEQESYEALLSIANLDERVRQIMQEQHKRVIRRLMQGEYRESLARLLAMVETEVTPPPIPIPAAPKEKTAPASPPAEPKAAAKPGRELSLDDMILDYLAKTKNSGDKESS